MRTTKKTEVPAKERGDDEDRSGLEHEVHLQLRDELTAMYEIHAATLDYQNLQSQAQRRALEVIESYRTEKIQQLLALRDRVKANGSPDGSICWNTSRGHHRAGTSGDDD